MLDDFGMPDLAGDGGFEDDEFGGYDDGLDDDGYEFGGYDEDDGWGGAELHSPPGGSLPGGPGGLHGQQPYGGQYGHQDGDFWAGYTYGYAQGTPYWSHGQAVKKQLEQQGVDLTHVAFLAPYAPQTPWAVKELGLVAQFKQAGFVQSYITGFVAGFEDAVVGNPNAQTGQVSEGWAGPQVQLTPGGHVVRRPGSGGIPR